MDASKYRYNIVKEDEVMEDESYDEVIENGAPKVKKWCLWDEEEEETMKQMEMLEAEARQVFDPVRLTFNYGKKKATDLKENKSVKLPSHSDPHTESWIELIKNKIMEVFGNHRGKFCNKRGQQKANLNKCKRKV